MNAASTSPETSLQPDFIDDLLTAGVPLRTLIDCGTRCLDWLAQQSDDRMRISYTNEAGQIVAEKVTRAGLLRRASELGWRPWASDGEDSECVCFYDAIIFHDEADGAWWWAVDFDEDTLAPLCLPKRRLAASASRSRLSASRRSAARNAARRRQRAEQHKAALERAVESIVELGRQAAERAGHRFSPGPVRRRIRTELGMAGRPNASASPSSRAAGVAP